MIKLFKEYHFFVAIPLIIILGLFVYFNSLHNGFVYDDELVIVENPFLRSLSNIKYLFTKDYFSGSGEFTYRPVLTFTYLLDYHFWQNNPFGYHLTNVIIHILNAVFLYFFLFYFLPVSVKKRLIWPIALLSSILFVLHPIQTEVVNGAAFREDALFLLFFLPALIFYLKTKSTSSKPKKLFFYFLSLVLYFFALLSKEMALMLFFFILLIDFYDLGKFYLFSIVGYLLILIFGYKNAAIFFSLLFLYVVFKSKDRLKKILFYSGYVIITGIYGYILFFGMVNPNPLFRYRAMPLPAQAHIYLLGVSAKFASYIKLLFFPLNLSVEYPSIQPQSFLQPLALFSLGILIILFVFIIRSITRNRLFVFSWLWTIFPLGLVMVGRFQPIAEHQLYLSCAGFCLFLGALLTEIFYYKKSLTVRILIVTLTILILVFYSWRIITRNMAWKDELTFWQERIKYSPTTERAHSSLGDAYFHKKLYDKAEEQYKKALELNSKYSDAYYNLGNIYMERNLDDKAIQMYNKVLELDPFYVKALNNLGIIYSRKDQLDKAERQYKQILKMNPFNVEAYLNLGNIYSKKKLFEQAIFAFNKALQLNPNLIQAHYNLGNVYLNQGLFDKAITQYRKVLDLNPNIIEAYNNLGVIYFKLGNNNEAGKYWQKALEINPNYLPAKDNLNTLQDVNKD